MTDEARASLRLAALVCPACGNDLDGLEADRVFGCSACARAYSVEAEGLQAAPLVAWEADAPGEAVPLPVWVFEVEATVVLPSRARTSQPPGASAGDRLVPYADGPVYVAAFDLVGRGRFGDPGLHFTRRQPQVRVRADGVLPRLAGATLSRSAAEALVAPTILSVVDAREDVLGGQVDPRIVSATLALVPFLPREDGGVTEPFGGVGYPPAALPDLAAIRVAGRKGSR